MSPKKAEKKRRENEMEQFCRRRRRRRRRLSFPCISFSALLQLCSFIVRPSAGVARIQHLFMPKNEHKMHSQPSHTRTHATSMQLAKTPLMTRVPTSLTSIHFERRIARPVGQLRICFAMFARPSAISIIPHAINTLLNYIFCMARRRALVHLAASALCHFGLNFRHLFSVTSVVVVVVVCRRRRHRWHPRPSRAIRKSTTRDV